MKETVVVAVGGNALLQRREALSHENQLKNIKMAAKNIAALHKKYNVIIVHGNGPQIGLLALQNLVYTDVPPYPFDVLGAETQGMIGYLIQQAVMNCLPGVDMSTLVTQVEVDPADPLFKNPTKFIGPVYDENFAKDCSVRYQWSLKPDGAGWRRVVPSPEPKNIVELKAIKSLIEQGHIVVCCGGGGCPVVRNNGYLQGVEAVIDKDASASVLADQLNADHLLILTDTNHVYLDWGLPTQRPLLKITTEELMDINFAAGSMGPKIEACMSFVDLDQKRKAYIGALADASAILEGRAGTQITSNCSQKM
ncbi:carbamate kinase [Salmonella enterica subsp. diarizonae]|nr:carbamate kinase [Salmonella enterica subsp. diarizonae]EHG2955527.1 carbamate kinase [Salmonella enterica subsp. diarizonae serovar 53:r:z35]EJS8541111.1 carbamate kinase [Salmonella enterica]ECI5214751.1 carbamate kinase [Salmonella enterica subsp. diarizonae]EEI3023686.1 carbamate kinase [Salmonella enterica subsp. diarizonae]